MLRSVGAVRLQLHLHGYGYGYGYPSPFLLSAAASPSLLCAPMPASTVRIAVVGDVHDDWELEEDSRALQFLEPDLVLFTGDYGNENVELVRSISNLKMPKAAILGNHDCWHTHQFSEKKPDRVQQQLQCLGEEHVGYQRLDFPELKLSVVGGRPFSHGGDRLFRKQLLSKWYGVNDMEQSARKICKAATGTPEENTVVILAHNGPTGLGSKVNDICGRDWVFGGGDHGDPDLAQAISELQSNTQIPIPLVVFGHMHKSLAYSSTNFRKMIAVGNKEIMYLNGAVVPRVKHILVDNASSSSEDLKNVPENSGSVTASLRAFTVVDMHEGKVKKISETWVLVADKISVKEEITLFES
ncbi:calcineurin-like metallo-phosphoesterase superfamily protein [Carex rostrata]